MPDTKTPRSFMISTQLRKGTSKEQLFDSYEPQGKWMWVSGHADRHDEWQGLGTWENSRRRNSKEQWVPSWQSPVWVRNKKSQNLQITVYLVLQKVSWVSREKEAADCHSQATAGAVGSAWEQTWITAQFVLVLKMLLLCTAAGPSSAKRNGKNPWQFAVTQIKQN